MSILNAMLLLRDRGLRTAGKLSALAPLLIRVTLGLVFVSTGWHKLHSLANITEFFQTLGIPLPGLNAAVVASTEFFGGLLILVGLGTRLVALPLAFTMVIAILTARWSEVDGAATLAGFVETGYLVMFLVLAISGPGAISLDGVLGRQLAIWPPRADPAAGSPRPSPARSAASRAETAAGSDPGPTRAPSEAAARGR
jgi:putative oxidoreductase